MGRKINEHLIRFGDWGAEFHCTPLVIDVFKRRKIFFGFEKNCTGHEVIRFENGVKIEPYSSFQFPVPLWNMGAFSYSMSPWGQKPTQMSVGRYSSISWGCHVMGDRHPVEWAVMSQLIYYDRDVAGDARPWITSAYDDFQTGNFDASDMPIALRDPIIKIGHDVWIGADVRLSHNIQIGTGSVVGAGSIVTHDVEPYTIVAGVPARVIRPRFSEKLIPQFLELKWWEFGPNILNMCNYKEPEKFLEDLMHIREEKSLTMFEPELITFQHILNDLSHV